MCAVGLLMRLPRPLALAEKRFSVVPCSTKIVLTLSSSMSAPSLCSALAMADSRAFLIMPAAFLDVNVSMFSAWSTFLPRTRSATSRPLSADSRTPRTIERVSIAVSLLLRSLLVGRVTLERPGQRKLAELVPDHLIRDIDRHVLLAVVHRDRDADEIGQDRRAARPGLDRLLVLRRGRLFDLRHQVVVDERALLERAGHATLLTSCDARRSSSACACCCASDSPSSACSTVTPGPGPRRCGLRRRRAGGRPGSSRRRARWGGYPSSA